MIESIVTRYSGSQCCLDATSMHGSFEIQREHSSNSGVHTVIHKRGCGGRVGGVMGGGGG